mmetsp:Transcript_111172/g.313719  ORF Transcript_111172/g.313719 Transcript_111172/m.313719 type:complete len:334 (+) Transcript_111172:121-1122(+)
MLEGAMAIAAAALLRPIRAPVLLVLLAPLRLTLAIGLYETLDNCYDRVEETLVEPIKAGPFAARLQQEGSELPPEQDAAEAAMVVTRIQMRALERLQPSLAGASQLLDLGFGRGVMMAALLLSGASPNSVCTGVDMRDRMKLAKKNLGGTCQRCMTDECMFAVKTITRDQVNFIGSDWFALRKHGWPKKTFEGYDVIYAGCALDMRTKQLPITLMSLSAKGAAVLNYGAPDRQAQFYVNASGACEHLESNVRLELCESPATPPLQEFSLMKAGLPHSISEYEFCAYVKRSMAEGSRRWSAGIIPTKQRNDDDGSARHLEGIGDERRSWREDYL